MNRMRYTHQARNDIDEIFDYIAHHFLSKEAAKNTVQNIKLSIKKLEDFPDIGINVSHRLKKLYRNKTLKMLIAGNYLVFYIVENGEVIILRVLYQKRNWIEIFGK